MGGKNAAARISGEITNAADGEVAQLYAQTFPFTAAPIQVNASILHPVDKAAAYSFQVTPSVATRYQVKLFRSSTERNPFASSPVTVVYVAADSIVAYDHYPKTCNLCHETVQFRYLVPAATLGNEISKKLYFYFALNQGPNKNIAQPESLNLGSGSPQVSIQPVSVTEFDVTIAFSYRINGTNYASSSWEFCFPDTEPQDGLGLPGHHGCGDKQISYSSDYVG